MKRNRNLNTSLTLTALIVMASILGCQENEGSSTPTGSITIAVTDSPIGDASAVFVQFTGLKLYNMDGSRTEITFDEPKRVDLLSLQGSLSEEVLTEYSIPAGDYSHITFDIDFDASYLETAAETFNFELSNLRSAGSILKDILIYDADAGSSIVPFSIQEGLTTDLTFDFDLRKSIFSEDTSNTYSFSPAIRSVLTNEAGNIAGNVTSIPSNCVLENSAIYAYSGRNQTLKDIRGHSSDPISTSSIDTDNGNSYELGFLHNGDYTLAIACDAADDAVNEDDMLSFEGKQNITVVAGETTNHDF